MKPAPTKEAN